MTRLSELWDHRSDEIRAANPGSAIPRTCFRPRSNSYIYALDGPSHLSSEQLSHYALDSHRHGSPHSVFRDLPGVALPSPSRYRQLQRGSQSRLRRAACCDSRAGHKAVRASDVVRGSLRSVQATDTYLPEPHPDQVASLSVFVTLIYVWTKVPSSGLALGFVPLLAGTWLPRRQSVRVGPAENEASGVGKIGARDS